MSTHNKAGIIVDGVDSHGGRRNVLTSPTGALQVDVLSGAGSAAPVTPNSAAVGASASQTIPAGAKGWSITILTGTATFNGAAGLPAGFSAYDPGTTTGDLVLTTDAASSAYAQWNT